MANSDLRTETRKPVNVTIEFKGRKRHMTALTHNLSLGGMFVATREPLPISEKTFFTLKTTEKPLVFNLEGEVVWNNGRGCRKNRRDLPRGMGIRFLDNRVSNKDAIKSFVNFIEESTFSVCV